VAYGQDIRRQALARAAFDLVAERAFEGLRTLDVAARVGVNIATLHYHFATKEDLVAGIAAYVAEEYAARRGAAAGDAPVPNAVGRLRAEFADARHDRFDRPALQRVSLELRLRAERDPVLRAAVEPLTAAWRHALERILADGVFDGEFRADLDVPAAATEILATLWGATSLFAVNAEAFDAACAEIERMVRARA
jgi:AcrR family transcriptional regulator